MYQTSLNTLMFLKVSQDFTSFHRLINRPSPRSLFSPLRRECWEISAMSPWSSHASNAWRGATRQIIEDSPRVAQEGQGKSPENGPNWHGHFSGNEHHVHSILYIYTYLIIHTYVYIYSHTHTHIYIYIDRIFGQNHVPFLFGLRNADLNGLLKSSRTTTLASASLALSRKSKCP